MSDLLREHRDRLRGPPRPGRPPAGQLHGSGLLGIWIGTARQEADGLQLPGRQQAMVFAQVTTLTIAGVAALVLVFRVFDGLPLATFFGWLLFAISAREATDLCREYGQSRTGKDEPVDPFGPRC